MTYKKMLFKQVQIGYNRMQDCRLGKNLGGLENV